MMCERRWSWVLTQTLTKTISNSHVQMRGIKACMGTFYLLFCSKCQEVKPSLLVKKFPSILPTSPSIKDIQDSWDQMIAEDPSIKKEVDICGTLIPNDPSIIADPNNRRFILRPADHADKYKDIHLVKPPPPPAPKRPLPATSTTDSVVVPPKKNTFVGNSTGKTYHQLTKQGKKDGRLVDVTVKSGKWSTSADIRMLLDPNVSMFTTPTNEDQELAQDHCLSIILAGANKNMSQEATMHIYQESLKGLRNYYKKKLGCIEVEGKKFTPPAHVLLNDKNHTYSERDRHCLQGLESTHHIKPSSIHSTA